MPIGQSKLGAVFGKPGQIFYFFAPFGLAGKKLAALKITQAAAQIYQAAGKARHLLADIAYPFPVNPGNDVVLIIGIIIAHLGIGKFVAGKNHRRTERQQQR